MPEPPHEKSATLSARRTPQDQVVIHLTAGDGGGARVIVSPELARQMANVLEMIVQGQSLMAECGSCTRQRALSYIDGQGHAVITPVPQEGGHG